MPVAIKKYKFHITKTEFCGFILKLKKLFITELILKIYTLSLLTVVETDVLDFALGVYLV